ncbi:MAG: hypothetical protein E6778_14780 [Niallia nealsonii]|nr:hypothetical protein [Niallia nealsonii]
MNVSDAAYRVGQAIKKSNLGREHNSLLNKLKIELSNSAQSHISSILSMQRFTGFGNHFYSYIILNNILEENKDNKYFKDEITEIFSNANYHRLLKVSKELADEISSTLMHVFTGNDDIKLFGTKKEEVPKLRRALVDLQRQIQRTGFIEWALYNSRHQILLSEYESKREKSPFSKQNNHIRKAMAKNQEELARLNNIETVIMMMDYIRDMIFNAHRDNIIELNLNQFDKVKLITTNGIKIGFLVLYDEMISKKSFFIKVIDGYKTNYGIATTINTHFNNREGQRYLTTKLKVYLFPENDTNIFRIQ